MFRRNQPQQPPPQQPIIIITAPQPKPPPKPAARPKRRDPWKRIRNWFRRTRKRIEKLPRPKPPPKPKPLSSNALRMIAIASLIIGLGIPLSTLLTISVRDYQDYLATPLCQRPDYIEKLGIEYPGLCHHVEEINATGLGYALTISVNGSLGPIGIYAVDGKTYYYDRLVDNETHIIKWILSRDPNELSLYHESNGTAKIFLIKDWLPGRESQWRYFLFKENLLGKWAIGRPYFTEGIVTQDTIEDPYVTERGLEIFRSEFRDTTRSTTWTV